MEEDDDGDDGEKSEEPSQYRIDEFREKGVVAASKEIVNVLALAGIFLCLLLSTQSIWYQLQTYYRWLSTLNYQNVYTQRMFTILISHSLKTIFFCVLPIFGTAIIMAIFSHIVQFGFIFTPEGLSPKFERINPISGFKRIFSSRSIYELFKSSIKFIVVVWISYVLLKKDILIYNGYLQNDFSYSLDYSKHFIIKLVFSLLLGVGVIAALDLFWEKYQYRKKLLQTKQQIKQETKEREGNPEIRQRIRTIQREMIRKRMMNDVPKADVIITNPTHFSIAVQYDPKTMMSPKVIAKGKDNIALKIREIAKANQIPLVENRPLAQSLYKQVKIGQSIPRDFYKAVAEVLAYVIKLRRRSKL